MVKLASPEQAKEKKATRAAYGVTLAALAEEGMNIVAVDADLTGSTTTKKFAQARPENEDRLFNVGIAEQNMVGVAAGLSLAGNIAFTGSFAVFGTGRAYDQIRNTVCYSNLNVKIAPTHAGISVGPDGGSHRNAGSLRNGDGGDVPRRRWGWTGSTTCPRPDAQGTARTWPGAPCCGGITAISERSPPQPGRGFVFTTKKR